MAEITDISPQAKDKERCNVYVDGSFYCGMKLETVVKYRLKTGSHIERERLDEIQLENEKSQALDKALTHISAAMKTEKQMRDFLKKKGYLPAVCDYVIAKLREYAFVDDAQYCEQYVETAGKRMGGRRIAFELKKRGASEESIAAALENLGGEEEAAREVLAKYMRHKEGTRENYVRAFRHLMSRGFSADVAKDALASLGAEEEEG